MVSRWLRVSLGAALSLSFALAACDRPADITSPGKAVPQFSPGNGNANGLGKRDLRQVIVAAHSGNSWSCDIGPSGGTCALPDGSVSLSVPKKAVGPHTTFSITLLPGEDVTVSLTATSGAYNAPLNDVGSAGFSKPVTLTINKFGAVATDPDGRIIIGWKVSDTQFVPQPTAEGGSSVSSQIWHFSDYTLLQ
jgi:hypothetical protein